MFIRRVALPALFIALVAAGNAALASSQDAALASSQDAARFVDRLGKQTIETLRASELSLDQRRDRFRGLLSRGFDIPFIGRFVIGRYWRAATPGQRGEYLALYSEFFLQTYVSRIGDYAGQSFAVTGVRTVNAKDFVVRTEIARTAGRPFTTDWRVRLIDGRYRVIDIMVEGISMAVTQRSEFASVARRGGLEGLLIALRDRTAKISEIASLN